MENTLKLNKMGSQPIGKLLFTMSLPAIFSMLVQALYNVVDSIFVSKVSEAALDAVSIAYPMQMVVLAVGLGVGVGTNAIVARKLGEGRRAEADSYAQTGLMLALISSGMFIILGSFIPRIFMQSFSNDADIIKMGTDYLTICMVCCFGSMVELMISKTLQATGNMIVPMVSQLIGAITNIILDPIFIFVCKLSVLGAGIATVIGQISAMTFVMIMASRKNRKIQIFFHHFKPSLRKMAQILQVGAPVIFVNAVGGFITMIMNVILRKFSETAITVLSVYFKVQSFVFMPVFGLCQGALPIMAYNYGANEHKRYNRTFWLTIITAVIIMTLGTVLFQTIPQYIMALFAAKGELLTLGVQALRIISFCFLPAALGIVISNSYQAIGYGFTSLMMSMLRQVILIIPAAIIFSGPLGLGIDGVWYSYPFAEILTVLIFTPLFFYHSKKAFRRRASIPLSPPPIEESVQEIFDDAADEISKCNIDKNDTSL